LIKPAQASVPHCSIQPAEPDVVTLSSSDTQEDLELLSLSPAHGLSSRPSEGDAQEPPSSSGSDLFEDWPEANDMATSIYVALTTEASSSCPSMANAPRGRQKSRASGSSTRQPRSQAAPSQRSRQQKSEDVDAPCRRSKRTKKAGAKNASAASSLRGSLSAADFDQSEWEIMFPHFVVGGLVDPPGREKKKND
jgi:hypothetical protein